VVARVVVQLLEKNTPAATPEFAEVFSRRAALFFTLGRYDDAMQDAARCLRLDPQYSAGYFRLGSCLFAQGRFPESFETFMLVRAVAAVSRQRSSLPVRRV
jgi:tetratricopeptide (TPR) repeat protein